MTWVDWCHGFFACPGCAYLWAAFDLQFFVGASTHNFSCHCRITQRIASGPLSLSSCLFHSLHLDLWVHSHYCFRSVTFCSDGGQIYWNPCESGCLAGKCTQLALPMLAPTDEPMSSQSSFSFSEGHQHISSHRTILSRPCPASHSSEMPSPCLFSRCKEFPGWSAI